MTLCYIVINIELRIETVGIESTDIIKSNNLPKCQISPLLQLAKTQKVGN
jgi:hypothetical protein